MIKRIFLGVVLFIYIILIFFSACTSLTKKQPHISHVRLMEKALQSYDNDYLPYQNFIYIKKYVYYNEKDEIFCSKDNLSVDCKFIPYGEGSGIAIDHDKNKVRILTVHHVCEEQTWEALSLLFENEKGETDYPTFKLEVSFYGKDYNATVTKSDSSNDLCLMEIQSEYAYKTKEIKVASEKPNLGSVVYSLSAPLGIASDYTRMKFRGFWSGCDSNLTTEDYCYYTIPAAPGSSGSGVFNQYGELVSIISIAMSNFDEISGGPRQFHIEQLLKE
jgi:hypothetical protein